MSATTHSLAALTPVSVAGMSKALIYFNADAENVALEGSTGSDKFVEIPFMFRSGKNRNYPLTGNTDFKTGYLIEVDLGGLEEIQFRGGAVNIDLSPFDFPGAAPNDYATLGGLGDSQLVSGIVESGTSAQDLTTGRLGAMNGYNVLMWASGYSGGKLVYNGIAGTTGITAQVLYEDHLATAMAQGWMFCCISCGTNDIAAAVPSDTTVLYLERMIRGLLSVGTIPIVMGVLPNLVTLGNEHDELNIKFRNLVNKYRTRGVLFEDAYTAHVETTGLGIAAHFRDNTHLTVAQNKVRGARISALILAGNPALSDAYKPVANATGKTGLLTNPVFTANSGAADPTGWTTAGTADTSNIAAGTAVGNEWTHTRAADNASGTIGSIPAGATYVYIGGTETGGTAESSGTEIGIRDPAFNAAAHAWRWVIEAALPAGFVLAVKFTVPTGFPTNYLRQVNGGNAASTMKRWQNEVYPAA